MAFAGDNPPRDKIGRHSSLFQKLEKEKDILFLYLSGEGYVGVGQVETKWDERHWIKGDKLFYVDPVKHKLMHEYRISVNWYKDWRKEPKHWDLARLHVTPSYYQQINVADYPVFKKWAR
jgi:hypothetical protein